MQAIMQVTATDVNAMRRPCPMARCFLLWRGVSAVAGGMEPYKVEGGSVKRDLYSRTCLLANGAQVC